jgi:serine/threonine-protein kinase
VDESLPLSVLKRVAEACARFEAALRAGQQPRLEEVLAGVEGPQRAGLLRELMRLELRYRVQAGEQPGADEYRRRLPGHEEMVEALFAAPPPRSSLGTSARWPGHEGKAEALSATAHQPAPPGGLPVPLAQTVGDGGTPAAPEAVPVAEDIPAWAGRYVIEGEIARGGMGVVLRAHDPELNRPLAVKVLLSGLAGRPDVERRFLEEAQVAGQLQHPGVPPVHDIGRLEDGRPFFAMKLIKGHTLAELLKERKDPAEELPRWLGVFEQVCQALAYAHSRGVIHRDLKPLNVMVGAFGEVQVMDWGLAKVLAGASPEEGEAVEVSAIESRRSGEEGGWSQPGSVLGTPAFIAPEQARGTLELIDERSDVFGLGALLCVILTGQPPYRAPDVRRQARHANLADAFARLEGSGADGELVRLAKACLAAQKQDRPRDAGEVARAVAAYLGGVQERLRRAELERAQAQVKAAEERKRRRLALGLAAAVLVALVLVTAGGVYRQQQRQRAREQAQAGLEQAAELRQGYRFADAEAMLEQVRGWAGQAADKELNTRLDRAQAELELARDLDRVRQEAATLVEGKWDPSRRRALYPEILARHRLDVLGGDLDELAEAIRGSTVRESIVAALDDWAQAETDRPRKQRLLRLANSVDEADPWRQAVRQALTRRDGQRLRQLEAGTGQGKPTPGVVLLLAGAFRLDSEEPTRLLRQMQRERPGDFWVNFTLGHRLYEQKKHQEAAGCYLVALALRPNSAPT